MVIQKNCEFITKTQTPIVSKIFPNSTGDVLTVQIEGANGRYHIEGRNKSKGDWFPLAGIDLGTFTAVKGVYTKPGLYELGVIGVRELRARVESAEGDVSIFGQIISSEEA